MSPAKAAGRDSILLLTKGLSLRSHTLPQLPFSLRTLQLQPVNRIFETLLLLNQSPQLRRLRTPATRPRLTTPQSGTALVLAGC